jgi:hypothetical protein
MVGFWKNDDYSDYWVLETTVLGNEDVNNYIDDKTFLLGGLSWFFGISKNEISRNEFIYAINVGTESMLEDIDKFDNKNNYQYQIIDISDIRKQGIRNINK